MKLKEDPKIFEIIEEEQAALFLEKRDALRDRAKESIAGIQAENKKAYDKKRKNASCYQENDLVAIRRTQGGPGLKFCAKFFGPYKITQVLRNDRYLVQKMGQEEGPRRTSTSVDNMKPWVGTESLCHPEKNLLQQVTPEGSRHGQDGRV